MRNNCTRSRPLPPFLFFSCEQPNLRGDSKISSSTQRLKVTKPKTENEIPSPSSLFAKTLPSGSHHHLVVCDGCERGFRLACECVASRGKSKRWPLGVKFLVKKVSVTTCDWGFSDVDGGGCHDLRGRWRWLLRRRWWHDQLVAFLIAGCAKEKESSHDGHGGGLMELASRDEVLVLWLGFYFLQVFVDSGVILENAMGVVTRWRRRLRMVACGGPIKVARLLGGGPM
ncbi:hypothetical protein V8G54_035934 [Vigna mungo]|uniref:Uncharacterized protein n=1 Tax=Vigna mungo TaxID=3915 RepID=A0AAQ3MG01_VIGMU